MACPDMEILICEYVDGRISQKENRKLQEHIKKCRECAEEILEIKKYKEFIKKTPSIKLPGNYVENLINKLKERKIHRNILEYFITGLSWQTKLGIALSLSVVGLLLFTLINRYKERIPLRELIIAHNETLKEKNSIQKEISHYVSSTINLDGKNFIWTGK